MKRIPRPALATALYVLGLAAYGLLAPLAGPDPHAIRPLAWDYLAVAASGLLIAGVTIGCFHAADAIRENDGDAPWSAPENPIRPELRRVA